MQLIYHSRSEVGGSLVKPRARHVGMIHQARMSITPRAARDVNQAAAEVEEISLHPGNLACPATSTGGSSRSVNVWRTLFRQCSGVCRERLLGRPGADINWYLKAFDTVLTAISEWRRNAPLPAMTTR